MSGIACDCGSPKYPNTGRPNCVVIQKVMAMPWYRAKYKKDGTRNYIDVNADPLTILDSNGVAGNYATLGAYIQDLAQNPNWDASERLYPTPRVEGATFERTETVYETAPSTQKYKIDGVGGVRTMTYQMWDKDSAAQIQRELSAVGCSDIEFYYVDISANMWGIMDDPTTGLLRGYELSAETFDVFKDYATDTTVQKLNVSVDFDNEECEENSYVLTSTELGFKPTQIKGLISASISADNPDLNTIVATVATGFGTAQNSTKVVGLLDAAFIVEDVAAPGVPLAHTGTVENPDGTYTISMTAALTSTDNYIVKATATGYDVADGTFVA